MMRIITSFILLLILPCLVRAEELSAPEGPFLVTEVVDGDTLRLEDGRQVRLVGLQAPKLPLGRTGFKEWPFAKESKQALEELTLNKQVTLCYGGLKTDRYNRALAHLFLSDGTWIQGEMLARGMARVYSFRDNRALVRDMQTIERDARRDRQGLWALSYYAIKHHLEAGRFSNSFQIVEGTIMDIATVRGRSFVNFGEDWKTDFTIVLEGRSRRLMEDSDINLTELKGKKIHVRGWLKYYNGPMMQVTHPEQIQIIGIAPAE
ncbi:thermonuclease family protein [Emcibacter sp.]|uniref:thermonuclease family protein n=1 Tax=Emcibacter sp. TaxID=1979954 RepID=UPI002AA80458|nr:thermonuclease family protein [Emcibacter sp.]